MSSDRNKDLWEHYITPREPEKKSDKNLGNPHPQVNDSLFAKALDDLAENPIHANDDFENEQRLVRKRQFNAPAPSSLWSAKSLNLRVNFAGWVL